MFDSADIPEGGFNIPNFPEAIDWSDVTLWDDGIPQQTGDPIFMGPNCIGVYDWQLQWVMPIVYTT